MMEAKIQKQVTDYFSFFDEYNTAAKSSLRECQNHADVINKLIKRCKNIKAAQVARSPLAKFEDLQSKLCAYQHKRITEYINLIYHKQCVLEKLAENLYLKNQALRESCREIDLNDLNLTVVKGSPIQPSLKQLLEYADDTISFASHTCAQIDTALKSLPLTKLDTEQFADHFSYPIQWFKRISEIIQYTAFMF
ncbi:unnamed protein product [Arctia plantaginis]|uniref:Uncharacterized protein n=1 Tax=Arctia plantaginis TaxID=874455 RepID=A0A8S0YQ57_ARCPL|nr:unnamed protein product [Arctia plantaginis]CAB3221554.1 unnamed protein product [Arctia plantaginis]